MILTPIAQDIKLSAEQLAILNAVDQLTGRHLLVLARAGTGKTFVIRKAVQLMRGTVAIAAFNRKIANDIKGKLADDGLRADVGTFHSFGDRIIRAIFKGSKLEGTGEGRVGYFKFTRIAEELEIPQFMQSFVRKAVSMAMAHGFGVEGLVPAKDLDEWQHIVSHYDIDNEIADDNAAVQLRGRQEVIKEALRFAYKALNLSKKLAHEVYTHDEQLWLPLLLNAKFPTYNNVCVDEAQDSNNVRREMARRMLAPGGMMLFVGDEKQAINGFSGADNDALDIIREQFNCQVFPMTTTFRCSKAVVRLAQTIVPDFKAADSNPEGSVSSMTEKDFANVTLHPETDAIICRNTKPLVDCAFSLIRRGVACHVEGKEIGQGLIALATRWRSIKSLPVLVSKLGDYRERQIAKLLTAKKEVQAEGIADRVDTVLALIDSMPKGATVNDLKAKIETMFVSTPDGQKPSTVTLLTAHKSKGLEFHTVYGWAVAKFMPSKYAKQAWQLEQEDHLRYVL